MRKTALVLLTLIALEKINSQVVFSPPGAEWHYLFNWMGYYPGTTYNEKIKYVGDSINGTDTLKVLSHTRFFLQCNNVISKTLLKQKGDTIYFKNSQTQNSWQILYNFATLSGHNWTTSILLGDNSPATFTFSVTNVQQITQNNFNLKNLVVTVTNNVNTFTTNINITERLGSSGFLFQYDNFNAGGCDADDFRQRLCYQDNSFGTLQFSSLACNYYTTNIQGISESKNEVKTTLFPNPAREIVNISTEISLDKTLSLEITDVTGRLVKTVSINSKNNLVNIGDYKSGVYFVNIIYEGRVIESKRLLIEN